MIREFVRGALRVLDAIDPPAPPVPPLEPVAMVATDTSYDLVDWAVASGRAACASCSSPATTMGTVRVGRMVVDLALCASCSRRSNALIASHVEDAIAEGRITIEDGVYGT